MSKQAMIKTELGLLPSDWKIVQLSDVGTFSKGAGISREDAKTGRIPAVRYGELYTTHDNYIYKCTSFISPEIAKTSKKIRKGFILFTGSGETKEDIGKAVAFIDDYEAYAGGDIIILSPKKDYESLYLGFILNSLSIVRQRASFAQGDSVVHITANAIKQFRIPIPPAKEEQSRIATALYDIDTLIRNLDCTIEKKKNIRQGAMEQLLSGKKRLPGFKGEWKHVCLKDVADMYSGGTPKSSEQEYYNGDINFLSIGDMTNAGKYITKTEKRITQLGLENSSARIFPSGTLMYAMYASLGKCSISTIETAISQAILGFILSDEIDRDYLYYHFCYIENKVKELGQTGTQSNLSKTIIEQFELDIPDIKEQRAIADLLTAMDDEIAVLQMERDKYANIRSGMMDDLLTGAKRI